MDCEATALTKFERYDHSEVTHHGLPRRRDTDKVDDAE